LSAAPTFDSIAAQIERDLTILCCHRQCCCDDSRFARAVYCVRVDNRLFDLFFNSQNGYRSSYYESPYRGLEANAFLLRSALRKLLDWARRNPDSCEPGGHERLTTG
jgi:hypothetical protein